jgi:ubiquinone/menaquinone biosynthesis C-methylase UbiE
MIITLQKFTVQKWLIELDKKIKKSIMEDWNREWHNWNGINFLAETYMNIVKKHTLKIINEEKISRDGKVLDVGCGSGTSLLWFKNDFGFKNSIGIDSSPSSIKLCIKNGFSDKDVLLMDAFNTTFKDNEFDLVFAGGVLEHFPDCELLVKEMCRISKKYILLTQPNHFGIYKKLTDIYYKFIPERGSPEYTYKLDDFIKLFKENGFRLKRKKDTLLNGFWILLFELDSKK